MLVSIIIYSLPGYFLYPIASEILTAHCFTAFLNVLIFVRLNLLANPVIPTPAMTLPLASNTGVPIQ